MRLNWIIGGAIALSIVSCNNDKKGHENANGAQVELKTNADSLSYALGVNISDGFVKQKIANIKAEEMGKGFNDYLNGSTKIEPKSALDIIQNFLRGHQIKMMDTTAVAGDYRQSLLDSVSYALGVNISESFKQQGVEGLEGDLLAKGFEDFAQGHPVLDGNKSLEVLQNFMMEQQKKQAEQDKLAAAPRIEEGKKFLEENGKRPEVTTLPSGLEYEILKEGNGPKPTINDKVKVHYHGTLIDGTVFDSSVDRGEPIEFPLSQVIKGWTEGLQLMPVGSKWRLYIPYNLAYGEQSPSPKIPAYSTLIFDVELLDIPSQNEPKK